MLSSGILSRIGNTPLIKLSRLLPASSAGVAVKPEYLNPSGSIKDRIALRMVEEAERQGRLRPGMNIIEASTGNTATALAFVGATKGYRVTLYVPKNATSEERIRMCRAYGAEVIEVDIEHGDFLKESGVHGALVEFIPRKICHEKEQRDPEHIWWARQFSSQYNIAAHQDTTAQEILEQTSGKVDAFVAAIGTGGTLVGVAMALRNVDPSVKIIAVEPKESRTMRNGKLTVPIIEGYSGGILLQVAELADEVIAVGEKDAVGMCHRLAEEEGLFCGVSSGANVLAALQVAQGLGPDKQVVTILPDSRDRYTFVERFTT